MVATKAALKVKMLKRTDGCYRSYRVLDVGIITIVGAAGVSEFRLEPELELETPKKLPGAVVGTVILPQSRSQSRSNLSGSASLGLSIGCRALCGYERRWLDLIPGPSELDTGLTFGFLHL